MISEPWNVWPSYIFISDTSEDLHIFFSDMETTQICFNLCTLWPETWFLFLKTSPVVGSTSLMGRRVCSVAQTVVTICQLLLTPAGQGWGVSLNSLEARDLVMELVQPSVRHASFDLSVHQVSPLSGTSTTWRNQLLTSVWKRKRLAHKQIRKAGSYEFIPDLKVTNSAAVFNL